MLQQNGGIHLHLKEQQYILALEKYQNFTKAAEALHITQPALTTFVNKLEQELGIKLFLRQHRQVKLTAAGELYVRIARQMMELKTQFDMELAHIARQHTAHLRVGIQTPRAPTLIPSLTIALKKANLGMTFSFQEGTAGHLEDLLEDHQVDIILYNNYTRRKDMEYIPLAQDYLLLVLPPNHPAISKAQWCGLPWPVLDLRELVWERFLLLPEDHSIRHRTDQLFHLSGISPTYIETHNRTETVVQLAAAGHGVTFSLESYLNYFHLSTVPRLCLPAQRTEPVIYSVAYRKGRFHPEELEDFVGLLREMVAESSHLLGRPLP